MKKILSILILCFFVSCDNELDINDDWKDIPVLYVILNSGTEEDADGSGFTVTSPESNFNYDGDGDADINYDHFVRVQKSFLGDGSAYDYADISDSIYYDPNQLEVWMELVDNQTGDIGAPFLLDLVENSELNTFSIFKDDGVFNSDNHYLYKIPSVASDLIPFDDLRKNYKISILNNLTGDTAFAETNIVEPISMTRPKSTGPSSIVRLSLINQPFQIQIKPSKNAKMYAVSLRFNYIEQHKDDYLFDLSEGNSLPTTGLVYKHVEWTLSDQVATEQQLLGLTNATIDKVIYGAQFFEFLKAQISEQDISSPEFYRYPLHSFFQNPNGSAAGMYHRCIDLSVTAVNSELYTYLNANAPNMGLNQERPEYNNITNGVGHASSRSILNMNNLRVDPITMDSISFGEITKNLNFACYSTNTLAGGGVSVDFGFDCQEN